MKTIQVLILFSVCSFLSGILLPDNNALLSNGGTTLTDQHYIAVVDMVVAERKSRLQLEETVNLLRQELLSVKKESESNARNISDSKDDSVVFKEAFVKLQKEYNDLDASYINLQQHQANLQKQLWICNNETAATKIELDKWVHSNQASYIVDVSKLQRDMDKIKIDVNLLTTKSNARSQDFLALLNNTLETKRKISTLDNVFATLQAEIQNTTEVQNFTNYALQQEFKTGLQNYSFMVRKNEVALSVCTAASHVGHIEAVYRNVCDGQTDGTCNEVCKRQDQSLNCFDAVHVYSRSSSAYISAHRYEMSGCTFPVCGPNYCCCRK